MVAVEETLPRVRIDRYARRLWVEGSEINLTRREFDTLCLLADHPGKAIRYADVKVEDWWTDQYLRVWISRLRNRLGVPCISTLLGYGYRLDATVE